jgi:segregation and condensation protein B
MDQTLITRIVEAALLAANQPLSLAQLHALFPLDEPAPADSVEQALETLRADCANRGVELVELASGFRYQVQADVHAWVARLWTERQTKYTRATLETLALIAYRQPITRGEIEQVRGVAVNSNIIKALEEREWIRVIGHRDVPGRPELLGTTKHFLDYFGLKRLDELPPLSELKDFGELEPQFQFDGNTPGNGVMPIGDVASDSSDDDMPSDPDDEDFPSHDTDGGIDADIPHHDESQDESNDPALAEDGDSTRSNTNE